ncbi:MAG TPA: hypothetical protein VMU84_14790 [Thermoanaerobaculia bacterium]|nr:hypothetical protein [Thermoanaerobaculia bacterium]
MRRPQSPLFDSFALGVQKRRLWSPHSKTGLLFLPLFALTLYPPQAFDEILYHLSFVRSIATSGAIRFLPQLRFPIFPQLHESLCAPIFLAFGDTATHVVAFAEIILLAAILIEWRGNLAAAIALGSPIVVHIGTITYVDAALALFVAAGFYCLDREKYAWSALLLGTACSVKYLGLYFAGVALLVILIRHRRELPMFLATLIAAMTPMYARIVALAGNPVFPFFGKSPWAFPMEKHFVLPWRLLYDITFARARTGMQPPYSPLFAIALLITIVAAFRNRRAMFVALLSIVYIAILAFLPSESRYLLPLAPLVAVVVAELAPKRNVLALIAIAPAILYACYRLVLLGPLPLTPPKREAFLEARLDGYRALKQRGPGRIYVCGAELLKYYGGDDFVGDVYGPQLERPPDVRNVLIVHKNCEPPRGFERVYSDGNAELWRAPGRRTYSPPISKPGGL